LTYNIHGYSHIKKIEFAKNAAICQKYETAFLTSWLIVDSLFIVALTKNKSPIATARSHETPKELANVTAPNIPAIVNAVSEKGSFIKV
jgi:hypothetical protein